MDGPRLVVVLALVAACGKGTSEAARPRGRGDIRFPVEAQPVEVRRVDYQIVASGAVEAFERVQVAARVAGAIERITFVEGDHVAAGQTLAYIDTERYRIAVDAARAALDRAEASLAEANAGNERRQSLTAARPQLIAPEEADMWRAKAAVAAAQVAEARAALARAELDRRYATPAAPVAGIIETRNVETGQWVQLGTLLATLVRRDPLLLKFKVPEKDAATLKVGMAASFRVGDDSVAYTARVTHVGQSADAASRLVAITAQVDDVRRTGLRPGSFATVTVVTGAREAGVLVPQLAVRPTERGFVAFTVDGDTAHERILRLGMRTADGLVEVLDGLAAGERVVVRGAEALADGVKVSMAASPSPAAAAAGASGGSGAPGGPEKALR